MKWALVLALVIAGAVVAHAEEPLDKEFQEILNEELGPEPGQTHPTPPAQAEPEETLPPKRQAEKAASPVQVIQQKPAQPPKRVEYIHHPLARKGLIRITEHGEYIYKVKRRKGRQAATVAAGFMSSPNLFNPNNGAKYSDIYGNTSSGAVASYEYQFFRGLGKLAIKAGTGVIYATGHGRFVTLGQNPQPPPFNNLPAMERFTFYTFPNYASLIYRAQYWDKQPLVPYGEAGMDYYTFMENRSDKQPNRYGASPATHLAAGLALNFGWLDKHNFSQMEEDYGITALFFYGEYRNVIGLDSNLDMSSQIISGGLMAEF